MSAPHGDQPQNIPSTIAELTDRATLLVREEIELAKAEVSEKATRLARGAIVGVVAGVFFVTALMFVLIGCAWLLYYYLPGNDFTYFWGFFAMAVILVFLGVIAGLIAARAVKRSSPPMPSMAMEEARKTRDAVTAGPPHEPAVAPAFTAPAPAPAPAAAPAPAPPPPPEPAVASAPEEPAAPAEPAADTASGEEGQT